MGLVALAVSPGVALGSIDVSTTADELDAGGAGSTGCSLREAISSANSNTATGGCATGVAGLDLIALDAGANYVRTLTGATDATNATGDLDISEAVTITVPGGSATISGAGAGGDRVLDISASASISNVEIRGGQALGSEAGGGIRTLGGGSLYLFSSTIADNQTASFGGGIENSGALVELHEVTVSGNRSLADGGALDNSTGLARLYHSTITQNTANFSLPGGGSGAGGINAFGGQVELRNSILAGNIDESGGDRPDCFKNGPAVLFSDGGSVIGSTTGCTIAVSPSDKVNVPSGLSPALAANGGGTRTHALVAGSIAIDNGLPVFCEPLDQRGVGRSGNCDSGAYEFVPPAVSTPPAVPATPTPAKKCPKGKKLKKGKCVKKKRKKKKAMTHLAPAPH